MGWNKLIEFLSEKNYKYFSFYHDEVTDWAKAGPEKKDKCFKYTMLTLGLHWVLFSLDKYVCFVEPICVDLSHDRGRETSGFITNNSAFRFWDLGNTLDKAVPKKGGWVGTLFLKLWKRK